MDAASTDSKPLPLDAAPTNSTEAKDFTRNYPKAELSPEVQAFLHRMAENLCTHDPDVPKGRYRP